MVLLIAPMCPNTVEPPYNICLFSNITFVVVNFFLVFITLPVVHFWSALGSDNS